MNLISNSINVDNNGNINNVGWVEWQHVSFGFIHCPICLVLDKCWFCFNKKPKIPQHIKCHCIVNSISKPIANINSKATCDIRKFSEYIFSDKYAWNGKRKLFESLGFSKEDSQYLKNEYERQAVKNYCDGQYSLGNLDISGQRININIEFKRNGRQVVFKSGWMVKPKGLITNNTPFAG